MGHVSTRRMVPPILAVLMVGLLASAATAHNMAPPPWINTTHGLYADGHYHPNADPQWVVQFTGWPGFNGTFSPTPPSVTPISPTTELINPYMIVFPNWIDTLPLKMGRIQIYWDQPTSGTAAMVSIIGHDGATGDVPGVFGPGVQVSDTNQGYYGMYWDFTIQPNPDSETFIVDLPAGTSPTEIDIHTLSLPEPASIAVLTPGAIALLRRRRAQRPFAV